MFVGRRHTIRCDVSKIMERILFHVLQGELVIVSESSYRRLETLCDMLQIVVLQGALSFTCTIRMIDDRLLEVYDNADGWHSVVIEETTVESYILGDDFVYEREQALDKYTLSGERDVFSSSGLCKIPIYSLFLP